MSGNQVTSSNIKRSEIWLVNLDPTLGAEIRKTRPVVVISSDIIGALPIKLIAPITEWEEHLTRNIWHVKVNPDLATNGLTKVSEIDVLQLRGVDTQRFVRRLGRVTSETMQNILIAIAAVTQMNSAN